MKIQKHIEDDFFTGKRNNVVKFTINESAEVIEGQHKGKIGAVVSICQIEPKVILLVETNDGKDIKVNQAFLRLLGD